MVIKGLMDFDSSWYLCVLEWLTKTQKKYKSNQGSSDQRTLKLMNSVRVQKVRKSSEGWTEFRRLFMMNIKNQAQKFMNQMKNMQASRDLNKSPVKYID